MKKEIKEILDFIKEQIEEETLCYEPEVELSKEEAKLLLDYITTLQQDNKEWEMIFDATSKRPYAHKYLEEKKKELGNDKIIALDSEMIYKEYYDLQEELDTAAEELEYYKNGYCEIKEKIDEYKEEVNKLYKMEYEGAYRINKAREYIQNAMNTDFIDINIYSKDLLNILNGKEI